MNKSGHGGNIKYFSEKYNIPENLLLDFSANINHLMPIEKISQVINENIINIKDYPEPNSESLLHIAQEKFTLNKENFIFGNGATELLFLLMNYLKPKKVFIPAPSFSEYEIASKSAGAEIIFFDLINDFQDFNLSFLEKISPGDVLFICNPNNPTGTFFNKEFLEKILLLINKKEAYLFLDESFIDFIEEEKYFSLKGKIGINNNLFILYSLTKIYGIPGIRLGMLFGIPSIISSLYNKKDPWNVNIFAQKIGEWLFKDTFLISETKKYYKNERDRMIKKLSSISQIKIYKPSANYIFFEIMDESNVEELQEHLIKEKIIIRNCNNYPGLNNKFFRVAIKKQVENDFLYHNINNFFVGR